MANKEYKLNIDTLVQKSKELEVKLKQNEYDVIIAETKHCFTDKNLKPINLKKYAKQFSEKFENMKKALI